MDAPPAAQVRRSPVQVTRLPLTNGIEIYYRLSGRKYDDRLDWYHRSRDKS